MPALATRALLFYGHRFPNHPRKWWVHERLRKLLKVRVQGEVVVERRGLKWAVDPADYVQADVFWYGAKDIWEVWHIRRHLHPGAVFLDVGSNFGYYSVSLAHALGGRIRVHAFEPNPPTYARLERNISLNGLEGAVSAHRAALSDAEGEAVIVEHAGNSGSARVSEAGDGARVRTSTLDRFCREARLQRLDFLKLDVEGFEPRVLDGGMETLSRFHPTVLVELNPPALEKQGTDAAAVMERFQRLGYRLYEPRKRRLVPLEQPPAGEDYVNALCIWGEGS